MQIDEKAITQYLVEYAKKLTQEIGYKGTWAIDICSGYNGRKPGVCIYLDSAEISHYKGTTLAECAATVRAAVPSPAVLREQNLRRLRRRIQEATQEIEALGETVEEPAAHE